MRYSKALAAAALLVLVQISPAQSAATAKIDALLQPIARTNQFSGVVLASENGRVIYEKAFGMANAELKVPIAVNTRIGIASITKPMTSIILIRLVEEKKLGLEDTVAKFIPDFPNGDKITVSMLSQHRSGIPHRVMPDESETRAYSSAEMVEKIKTAKLAFEPGTQRLYSSAGYTLLTRVLEIAGGRTYAQLLDRYVFQPAEMSDSVDWDGPTIIERRAQDYLRDERGYVNAPIKDYSFLVGAGSVLSTAADVHKFGMAIVDGKYGASARATFLRDNLVSSSGSTNGHRAYFEIKGDKSYALVLVANMSSGSFEFIQKGVTEILQGKEPSVRSLNIPTFNPTANKNLSEFVGRYRREGGGEFNIVLRNGYLFSSDIKMHPVKPDCFFDFRFYGDACFARDAAGKVSGLRWTGLTFELVGTRQE